MVARTLAASFDSRLMTPNRPMAPRARAWTVALLAAIPLAPRAGSAVPPAAHVRHGDCESRVILTFPADRGSHPDTALVADIARTARVRLEFLRSAGPGLYVFALAAPGDDPDCRRAIARLRDDSRVRSVDLDRRRRVQS